MGREGNEVRYGAQWSFKVGGEGLVLFAVDAARVVADLRQLAVCIGCPRAAFSGVSEPSAVRIDGHGVPCNGGGACSSCGNERAGAVSTGVRTGAGQGHGPPDSIVRARRWRLVTRIGWGILVDGRGMVLVGCGSSRAA